MGTARQPLVLCCAWAVAGLALAPDPAGAGQAGSATGPVAAAVRTVAASVPCSAGLVALTFDDGPVADTTPDFLTLLDRRRVPATFFVVGERVRANPALVRRADHLGFVVGNHSERHELLTRLGSPAVEGSLRRTRRAIRAAGVRPSPLVRPPYGAMDARVRGIMTDLGLVPVLWSVDPRDWAARSAARIATSTLAALRPHAANVVLLHDGVANAPRTLRALPRIIRGARDRGYCFAALDRRGVPAPPVPRLRVGDASVTERSGGSLLRVVAALDRPTSKPVSVRIRTLGGTAAPAGDYVAVDRRVRFEVGETRRVVGIRVRDDLRDEPVETVSVRASRPRGVVVADGRARGSIRDDDGPPSVRVGQAEVVEPVDPPTAVVEVGVRLERPSGRWVTLTVGTRPGTAGPGDYEPVVRRVVLAPGEVSALVELTVLADDEEEGAESFEVAVVEAVNAEGAGAVGLVTILPPAG